MAVCVWFLSDLFSSYITPDYLLLKLGTEAVMGVTVYTGVHLFLWWLCGSPDVAEKQILGFLTASLGRMRKQQAN